MKIKKEYIGSKKMHPILRKYFLIEEGKEELYARLGFDIFDKPKKPKLTKKTTKSNVKTSKRRSNNIRSNGDGTGNV
jgi:hypothetical protein